MVKEVLSPPGQRLNLEWGRRRLLWQRAFGRTFL